MPYSVLLTISVIPCYTAVQPIICILSIHSAHTILQLTHVTCPLYKLLFTIHVVGNPMKHTIGLINFLSFAHPFCFQLSETQYLVIFSVSHRYPQMAIGVKNIFRILFLYRFFVHVWSKEVEELTEDNFNVIIKENKCVLIYATTEDCENCKMLYHKFLIVTQTFEKEDDIMFGRLMDETLLQAFEVTSYPGIIYYEYGSAVPKLYLGDITSGALTKLAADALKTDFQKIDRQHSLILTSENFDEIMTTEKQARLVMLHETNLEEIELYEEIAETYDNEDSIIISRINVDSEWKLRKRFKANVYPVFYWYPRGSASNKKRFGGKLDVAQMLRFVNKECNFFRAKGGRLNPYAGLIRPLDDVIKKYGKDLYEISNIGNIRAELMRAIVKLPSEVDDDLANFYLFLLDEIDEDKTIDTLDETKGRIFRDMVDAGPFQYDQLVRKRNIVQKYVDIIGKHLLEELSGGDIGEPLDIDKLYGFQNHGLEFHEEL